MYGVTSNPAFFTTRLFHYMCSSEDKEERFGGGSRKEKGWAKAYQGGRDGSEWANSPGRIARSQHNPEPRSKAGRKMELLPGMEVCSGFGLSCLECLRFDRNLWDHFKAELFFKNKIAFALLNKGHSEPAIHLKPVCLVISSVHRWAFLK